MGAVVAENIQYALQRGTHAHRLAQHMNGRWVSALRAAIELHIVEIHPRLPEIERAGGAYRKREFGVGKDKWAEYTLVCAPRVVGVPEDVRLAYRPNVPDDNADSGFIPPPRVDAA